MEEEIEEDHQEQTVKLSEGFSPNEALMNSFENFVDHYKKYKSLRTLIFR